MRGGMLLRAIVFLLLLVPAASGAYNVDQNKLGIAAGTSASSLSYGTIVAAEQASIGDTNSTNYTTQIGWIYTLRSTYSVIITVHAPVADANINSSPTITFDVNKQCFVCTAESDVNSESIVVDLNGVQSSDFDYSMHCTEFAGEFHCSYTETGLAQDADNNVSFRAANKAEDYAEQVERIVHYDATAPVILSAAASADGSDVVFSFAGSDAFTGIETYYVRADSGSWINVDLNTSYVFSGHASADHTYDVKAKDFADNNSLISRATYSVTAPAPAPAPQPSPSLTESPPSSALPVEGKFDIEIVRIDDPVEAGEQVDFTFLVSNNTNINDNAYIEYWLEKNGERSVSGSETLYLLSGQQKEVNESLLSLAEMTGSYDFYLTLTKSGQATVTRRRAVAVMVGAPTRIELAVSSLVPGEETLPLSFAIDLGSNRDETLAVEVEEKIYAEGRIVWEKKQTVAVTRSNQFFEEVYGLLPGKYTLEVSAAFKGQTEKVLNDFERKPIAAFAPPIVLPAQPIEVVLPFFSIIPLLVLLLLITALLILYRLLRLRSRKRGMDRKEKIAWITLIAIALIIVYMVLLYINRNAIVAAKLGETAKAEFYKETLEQMPIGLPSLAGASFFAALTGLTAVLGAVLGLLSYFYKGVRKG